MPSTIKTLRKKRTEHKRLVKKLDDVVREIVLLRDKACVTCGSTKNLQCGHLFSRVAHSTRWDLRNVAVQCMSCNYRHEFSSYPFTRWFIDKHGEKEWDKLHKMYSTPAKRTPDQLQELLERLETIKKSML